MLTNGYHHWYISCGLLLINKLVFLSSELLLGRDSSSYRLIDRVNEWMTEWGDEWMIEWVNKIVTEWGRCRWKVIERGILDFAIKNDTSNDSLMTRRCLSFRTFSASQGYATLSFTHPFTHLFTNPSTHPFTRSFTNPSTHPFIHLFTNPSTHPFTRSFIIPVSYPPTILKFLSSFAYLPPIKTFVTSRQHHGKWLFDLIRLGRNRELCNYFYLFLKVTHTRDNIHCYFWAIISYSSSP